MYKITRLAAIGFTLFAGAAAAAEKVPGLPDWSGTWINITGLYLSNPGTFRPLQGVGQATNPPPLNAEYDKKWKAVLASSARGEPTGDRGADCGWFGVPGVNVSPMPVEFLVTRDRMVMIFESGGYRLMYTDGRKPPEDLDPSFNGFSTGRWEGDALVVDTVGLRDDTAIDASGIPHTDQMTVQERIRKLSPDVIENEITMTDPGAFTRPWKAKMQFRRMPPGPENRIIEYVCEDNNRNGVGADGTTYTLGPDGKPLTGPVQ